jgi:hypothetical protein
MDTQEFKEFLLSTPTENIVFTADFCVSLSSFHDFLKFKKHVWSEKIFSPVTQRCRPVFRFFCIDGSSAVSFDEILASRVIKGNFVHLLCTQIYHRMKFLHQNFESKLRLRMLKIGVKR